MYRECRVQYISIFSSAPSWSRREAAAVFIFISSFRKIIFPQLPSDDFPKRGSGPARMPFVRVVDLSAPRTPPDPRFVNSISETVIFEKVTAFHVCSGHDRKQRI